MLYMFDLDDTLIEGFYKPEGMRPYDEVIAKPNVRERLAVMMTNDSHACFALITNQGGVAFGYQTTEQVKTKLALVLKEFEFFRSHPFSVHVCYTHPEATVELYLEPDDPRRKPGCGMLDEAMMAHRIHDRGAAFYVGDLPVDEQAAAAAGVGFMYAADFFETSVHEASAETH